MNKEELIAKIDAAKQVYEWQSEIIDYELGVKKRVRDYYNNVLNAIREIDDGEKTMDILCAYVNSRTRKIKFGIDAVAILLGILFGNFIIPIATLSVSSIGFVVINSLFEKNLLEIKEYKRILKKQQDSTYEELDIVDSALREMKNNLEKCKSLIISYDGKYKELEELEDFELIAPVHIYEDDNLRTNEEGIVKLLKK